MKNQRKWCRLYSTEIPTVGHSDKVADYISNSILSHILSKDKNNKVAIEVIITEGNVYVTGEVLASSPIEYETVVRKALKELGYKDDVKIVIDIKKPSTEILQATERGGAGNQCIVMGGAWNETEDFMPLSVIMARLMSMGLTKLSEKTRGSKFEIYPDGKVTVTLAYDRERKPVNVDTVLVNIARSDNFTRDNLLSLIKDEVINPVISNYGFNTDDFKCFVNSAGKFSTYGMSCDTGVSGRKSVSDLYGVHLPYGGSSIVGKDLTKTDTVATYYSRYIAKNIVAAKLASVCEIQLTYSIGSKNYTSFNLNMFGTNAYSVSTISRALLNILDFTTENMIKQLDIPNDFKYQELDKYGVFGTLGNIERKWERLDLVEPFLNEVKKVNDSYKSSI